MKNWFAPRFGALAAAGALFAATAGLASAQDVPPPVVIDPAGPMNTEASEVMIRGTSQIYGHDVYAVVWLDGNGDGQFQTSEPHYFNEVMSDYTWAVTVPLTSDATTNNLLVHLYAQGERSMGTRIAAITQGAPPPPAPMPAPEPAPAPSPMPAPEPDPMPMPQPMPAPEPVATAGFCQPGQSPRFVFGFATLADLIGIEMGLPIECEHTNPANGDSLQATTTGLSFYRQSTNTPTFTNGWEHWGLTGAGLVYWTGESIDPPANAEVLLAW